MRATFNGRNRGKSVSFRQSNEDSYGGDSNNREDFKPAEVEEPRTVKLLPDANMTISVPNDFRDTKNKLRGRGNHSILKGFRDDSTFVYNTEQSRQYSNRGFETYNARGRGRGRPRGLYHGYQSGDHDQEYVHNQDNNNQRNYRNRPLSGSYDYDYNGHFYGRQSSDSYNQNYNNKSQDYQPHGQKNYRVRQSSANYEAENDIPQEQQYGARNFRGRSKSASDRPRRGRGGRGHGRGRMMKDNEDGHDERKTGDETIAGDSHKDGSEDNANLWLNEEIYHTSNENKGETTTNNQGEATVTDENQKSTELNTDEIKESERNINVTDAKEEEIKNEGENIQKEENVEVITPDEIVKE